MTTLMCRNWVLCGAPKICFDPDNTKYRWCIKRCILNFKLHLLMQSLIRSHCGRTVLNKISAAAKMMTQNHCALCGGAGPFRGDKRCSI